MSYLSDLKKAAMCNLSNETSFCSLLIVGIRARPCTVAQKGQSQISLPKHKTISQNTNRFPKAQISFPKHKLVSQNTNRFLKTQINFSKHKPISRNTNQWTGFLFCNYQIGPGKDSFPGFSVSNMAFSVML